jgi:hypothetical protein
VYQPEKRKRAAFDGGDPSCAREMNYLEVHLCLD